MNLWLELPIEKRILVGVLLIVLLLSLVVPDHDLFKLSQTVGTIFVCVGTAAVGGLLIPFFFATKERTSSKSTSKFYFWVQIYFLLLAIAAIFLTLSLRHSAAILNSLH